MKHPRPAVHPTHSVRGAGRSCGVCCLAMYDWQDGALTAAAQQPCVPAGRCGCSLLDYADDSSPYDTCKCGHDADEHAILGECEAVVTPESHP